MEFDLSELYHNEQDAQESSIDAQESSIDAQESSIDAQESQMDEDESIHTEESSINTNNSMNTLQSIPIPIPMTMSTMVDNIQNLNRYLPNVDQDDQETNVSQNSYLFLQNFFLQRIQRELELSRLEDEQMNQALLESRELFDETDTTVKNDSAILSQESQRYSTIKIKDKRKQVCCICMENFSCNQQVYFLPCKHIFHADCLSEWVQYKNECPTCRDELQLK